MYLCEVGLSSIAAYASVLNRVDHLTCIVIPAEAEQQPRIVVEADYTNTSEPRSNGKRVDQLRHEAEYNGPAGITTTRHNTCRVIQKDADVCYHTVCTQRHSLIHSPTGHAALVILLTENNSIVARTSL